MHTDTLTPSTHVESLERSLAWRQTALARLTETRRPLAEALVAMPASVERLTAQNTLVQLDLSIAHTRRGLRWAERLLAAEAPGA